MSGRAWKIITNLGDSSLLLPYAVLAALWLLLSPSTRRMSIAWLGVVFIGGLTVATTKVLYMGWHLGVPAIDFIGLSGHTTLSFIVWPVLLALLIGRTDVSQTWGVAAGIAIGVTIGVSRLAMHVHSLSEVLLGAIVGVLLSAAFLMPHRVSLRLQMPRLWLLASMILPLMNGYGKTMPSGHLLADIARRLSGHATIYTRADLYSKPDIRSLSGLSTSQLRFQASLFGDLRAPSAIESGKSEAIFIIAARS